MPVPPPIVSAPYDTAETVLQMARVRLNDAIQSIGGDVLTDTAPFTQVYFNAAFRRLQEMMADLGSQRTNGHVYILNIPATESLDPGSQCFLSWTQYFDGVAYFAPPTVAVLPQDLMEPLKVKQRPSGTFGSYVEIPCAPQGIPSMTKLQVQRNWLWRNDALWLTGATQAVDLEIEYIAYLPDIVANFPILATPWYSQPVPIVRCANALSWYVAAEVAGARGDADAETLAGKGDAECRRIVNRQYRSRQRVNQRRRSFRRGSSYGYGYYG